MDNKTALAVIESAKKGGALTFVGQGLGEIVPLYKLEPTQIEVKPENFHTIQGKFVARKEVCDRIADASGITFTDADCRPVRMPSEPGLDLPERTVFHATAKGKTRLPDGSWRDSAPETYDFDYLAKAKGEAGGDHAKEKRLAMEYYKAGPMRAATGARLRVIRQLTGMPTAFEKDEIGKGKTFVFSRIVQNTDYILSTKEGQAMAIAQATGVAALLYGKKQAEQTPDTTAEPRDVTPPKDEPEAPPDDLFGDDAGIAGAATEEDERIALNLALEGYLEQSYVQPKAKEYIRQAINSKDWPIDDIKGQDGQILRMGLKTLCENCKAIESKKGVA